MLIKITPLLILGLLFFIFINFSFAACQMPDIAEYDNCLTGCNGISDLIQKANCGNTCIGNWSKSQSSYNTCLADEQEQARQKKLEEQRFLEQQQAAEKQKQLEEEIQAKVQEQNTPSPEVSNTVTLTHGQVEFWRDGKVSPITSGFEINAGDTIQTGGDGTVELVSEDGTVQLFGKDTTVGFIGLEFEPPRVVYPDTPEGILDPNFKLEFDNMAFWKQLFEDLVEFHHDNPPKYLKTCVTAMSGVTAAQCLADTATYVYDGITWFDKKIKKDYSTGIVVTPTTAITTDGTEFIVEVADDGATTVTTLEGTVFVTDLISRKTVIVGLNHKLTVPKTTTGLGEQELQQGLTTIEHESIDRWWIKNAETPKREIFFSIGLLIIILAVGIAAFLIKKHIKPKTKA